LTNIRKETKTERTKYVFQCSEVAKLWLI